MDELNQIQNPNVTSGLPSQPGQVSPMSQMPVKKKSYLFPITLVLLVAIGAFSWWYIGQMNDEPVVVNQPEVKVNQDAREDIQTSKEIGEVDMGNLDVEFQAVDSDMNSL